MPARIFVSHASEDKEGIVRPLAEALRERGFDVWYDEFSLELGDSLRRHIDSGLESCSFGLVILSPNFFAKEWPQRELDGLLGKENSGNKVVLPLWHEVDGDEVAKFSPILAGRLAAKTTEGVDSIVQRIERAISRVEFSTTGQRLNSKDVRYLVRFRVSGSDICGYLVPTLRELLGVDPSGIREVVVKLYDDACGIDPYESYVQMASGAKWFPYNEDLVLLTAGELVPELPEEFQPVGWQIPEASWYSHETLSLAEYEVEVLFARRIDALDLNNERMDYLRLLLTYDSSYLDDMCWGSHTVGQLLVRDAIAQGKLDDLEELARSLPKDSSRASFVFAVAMANEISKKNKAEAEPLIVYLLSDSSPLNDHWKDELKKRIGAQQGREPEHSITRQLKSESSVRARLRQTLYLTLNVGMRLGHLVFARHSAVVCTAAACAIAVPAEAVRGRTRGAKRGHSTFCGMSFGQLFGNAAHIQSITRWVC